MEESNSTAGLCTDNHVCIFQDVVEAVVIQGDGLSHQGDEDNDNEPASQQWSEAFFELANATWVGYRLPPQQPADHNSSSVLVVAKQDTSNFAVADDIGINGGKHSGKIVWEASFLLMQYLLECRGHLGRTLEVGAG